MTEGASEVRSLDLLLRLLLLGIAEPGERERETELQSHGVGAKPAQEEG